MESSDKQAKASATRVDVRAAVSGAQSNCERPTDAEVLSSNIDINNIPRDPHTGPALPLGTPNQDSFKEDDVMSLEKKYLEPLRQEITRLQERQLLSKFANSIQKHLEDLITKVGVFTTKPPVLPASGPVYTPNKNLTELIITAPAELEAKAHSGNTEAQFEIGELYSSAFKDLTCWQCMSSEVGPSTGGKCLRCGAVYPYYEKAADWYKRAAEKGSTAALWRLCIANHFGLGVPIDKRRALSFFNKADLELSGLKYPPEATFGYEKCQFRQLKTPPGFNKGPIISNGQYDFKNVKDELQKVQIELKKYVKSGNFSASVFFDHKASWGKTFSCTLLKKAPVWFIGDIHGDMLALHILTTFAYKHDQSQSPTPNNRSNLFFLGDFVDRGKFNAEIVAWLMSASTEGAYNSDKFNIMAVVGNHDQALQYDEKRQKFDSLVGGANFAEQLNTNVEYAPFGKAVLGFLKNLPRMVLLNKSIMAVHGGIPLNDVMEKLETVEDLHREHMINGRLLSPLEDLIWTRVDEDIPEKFVDRNSKGAQFGYRDFNVFIEKLSHKLYPDCLPSLAIRGHDHEPDNFAIYEKYGKCRLMTINALTVDGGKIRDLVIVRWMPSEDTRDPLDIVVFKIKVPEDLIHAINYGADFKSIIDP